MTSVWLAACAALLAGLAVGLATTQRSTWTPAKERAAPGAGLGAVEESALVRLRLPLAALAGVGAWLFVGSHAGPFIGVGAAIGAWIVLGRTESPAARRHREQLDRDLPTAVGLLASCLDAGSDVDSGLVLVGEALGGPVAERFLAIHHRMEMGASPEVVWRQLADDSRLGALSRTILRSHESGASVAAAVRRLSDDLAAANRAGLEALARRVGVKAALPLGLCFLPAFLVLGVIPMAVGLFTSMHLFD